MAVPPTQGNENSCRRTLATKWTAAGGPQLLEKYPNVTTKPESRANGVNDDGSVIVGYDNSPGRNGVYWQNGVEHFLDAPNQNPFVGEAADVTGGNVAGQPADWIKGAYKYYTTNNTIETIGVAPLNGNASSQRTDDAGAVIGGVQPARRHDGAEDLDGRKRLERLHPVPELPGDLRPGHGLLLAQRDLGERHGLGRPCGDAPGERALSDRDPEGDCLPHVSPDSPNGKRKNLDVTFPSGLDVHLGHGDTLGLCAQGGD